MGKKEKYIVALVERVPGTQYTLILVILRDIIDINVGNFKRYIIIRDILFYSILD